MLSSLKIPLPYFAGLLLVAVGLIVVLGSKQRNLNEQENIIKEKNSKIEYYTNELGTETAKRIAVEASKDKIEKHYEELIGEIKKRHDVKVKNLEAAILANTETTITDTVVVHFTDTLEIPCEHSFTFAKVDKFHSIEGSFDGVSIDYEFAAFDTLSFVLHRDATGFLGLGPKQLVVEGSSSSPYTKIRGIQGVKVGVERRRPFGIGVTAGYGITNTGLGPFIGLGLNYQLIRF